MIINNVISKNQYGFLKNIGTKEALAKISDLIYSNIDNKLPLIITFLNLAKAFDSVNHNSLPSKLYRYGIRGGPLELLRDYLSNRLHRAKLNNIFSDFKNVTKVRFWVLPENCIFLYSDVTAIVSCDKNWITAKIKMSEYLEKIYKWVNLNYLSLNINKTIFMGFGSYTSSVPNSIEIYIDNTKVNRVEQVKYLGAFFDPHLK